MEHLKHTEKHGGLYIKYSSAHHSNITDSDILLNVLPVLFFFQELECYRRIEVPLYHPSFYLFPSLPPSLLRDNHSLELV